MPDRRKRHTLGVMVMATSAPVAELHVGQFEGGDGREVEDLEAGEDEDADASHGPQGTWGRPAGQ
jgi:hypothetical protein